jgi:hypothetical protein
MPENSQNAQLSIPHYHKLLLMGPLLLLTSDLYRLGISEMRPRDFFHSNSTPLMLGYLV